MILAILQARMTSRRLPGKVLKSILGRPMLEMQIERILRCKNIDQLIIATSKNKEDDPIEALGKKLNIDCFRGDLANVLDRFYQACLIYHPQHIVRLTGDCPLTDPVIIDALIQLYQSSECDYANNCQVAGRSGCGDFFF
jgi:spore coat polysaccharide biosynthesis protein SpsF